MAQLKKDEYLLLSDGQSVVVPVDNQQRHLNEDEDAHIDRIRNVWGSSSGARSDFFGIYSRHRSAENERLQQQEIQWEQQTQNSIYQSIRLSRIQKESQKTAKRREKRHKKKINKKRLTSNNIQHNHDDEKSKETHT